MSIQPRFAEKIFDGTKQYEFRRAIFKHPAIQTVVVYASSPVQKVIGEFEIEMILKKDLDALWDQTKDKAGIEKSYFDAYFGDKTEGYAIQIKTARRYPVAMSLREEFGVAVPQSYLYLPARLQPRGSLPSA